MPAITLTGQDFHYRCRRFELRHCCHCWHFHYCCRLPLLYFSSAFAEAATIFDTLHIIFSFSFRHAAAFCHAMLRYADAAATLRYAVISLRHYAIIVGFSPSVWYADTPLRHCLYVFVFSHRYVGFHLWLRCYRWLHFRHITAIARQLSYAFFTLRYFRLMLRYFHIAIGCRLAFVILPPFSLPLIAAFHCRFVLRVDTLLLWYFRCWLILHWWYHITFHYFDISVFTLAIFMPLVSAHFHYFRFHGFAIQIRSRLFRCFRPHAATLSPLLLFLFQDADTSADLPLAAAMPPMPAGWLRDTPVITLIHYHKIRHYYAFSILIWYTFSPSSLPPLPPLRCYYYFHIADFHFRLPFFSNIDNIYQFATSQITPLSPLMMPAYHYHTYTTWHYLLLRIINTPHYAFAAATSLPHWWQHVITINTPPPSFLLNAMVWRS